MPEIKIGTSIGSNYEGYEQLVSIYHQMKEYSDTTIYLDFSSNRWFEANLCAVLGAICLLMEKNRVKIACSNMSNSLIDILTRNGFIGSNYLDLPDNHNGTVVSFQRFKHNQDNAFNGYITYIIHSGFISGYQNRYGDNLKPPTNVYHRMTA